jgi:outer membrane protein assembly factor BamB
MMPVRRAYSAVLACAFAIAGLVGCSSVPPPCFLSAARAYALEVTTAGRVRWQVPLGLPGSSLGLSPLAVGAVAVFARGDVLYGLSVADGHRVWSRASSQDIACMWRWQNLVVVLTRPGSSGLELLTGLEASTGHARWKLRISWSADGLSPTADGGMAILRGNGTLEVVGLSSGRVRWTRPDVYAAATPVAGGAVLVAANGRLTSYDDRTGQVRWIEALMPMHLASVASRLSLAAAGLVYLTGVQQLADGQWTPVLLGISAADGRLKWRFVPSAPEGSLDAYAPGLVSVTSSSGTTTWQDALDPATGRVRWQIDSAYRTMATPAGIITGSDSGQISLRDTLTGHTRWTVGLTSGWPPDFPALPVLPSGPLLIVPAAADGSNLLTALRMSDGALAWQVSIPEPVAAQPSVVPGALLVYTASVIRGC